MLIFGAILQTDIIAYLFISRSIAYNYMETLHEK